MNWDAIGATGEVVGAIAVVLTLGYLAIQIRQSNRAAELTAIQHFFDSTSSVNLEPSRDVELIKVMRKGYSTWEGLTDLEKSRFHLYWHDFIMKTHMGYRLRERGILDEASYLAFESFLLSAIQTPGVGTLWRESARGYPSDFRERIDSMVADEAHRPPPITTWLPYWVDSEES